MLKKERSHHFLGHHWPDGTDGVEIRVWDDARGYYASTIYNPNGTIPADIGPFPTSFDAIVAGCERHGLEFGGSRPGIPFVRRLYVEDAPALGMCA